MLSKLKIFLIILLNSYRGLRVTLAKYGGPTIRPPLDPRWHNWAEDITNIHLTNMTAEIVKDVKLKLEQSKTIQENYKHSITYELGTVAAGTQDTFAHMLEIYRTYANLHDFINYTHTMDEVLNAYHIIQGDYNQIRLERDLYYKILEKHMAIREQRKKSQHRGHGEGPHGDALLKVMDRPSRRNVGNTDIKLKPVQFKNMSIVEMDAVARGDLNNEDVVKSSTRGEGLPWKVTQKSTVKRIWKNNVKWFGEETHLD